jgi:prolyl oligopeptidase
MIHHFVSRSWPLAKFAAAVLATSCSTSHLEPMTYPESRTVDAVDTLWGTAVKDPYRWLEDDRDEEVIEWVAAQASTSRAFLDQLPGRQGLRDRCEELFNHPRVGIPRRIGEKVFLTRNDGLQNQSVIFVKDTEDAEERVFLDPNALSEDGTVTANLSGASPDGRYVVEVRNAAGSDWQEMRVIDLETGEFTGEVLEWVKFSGASWVEGGFYYSRYPAPEGSAYSAENTFHSVYFHKVGTPQAEDELVFRNDNEPNRYHFAGATEDGQYVVLNTSTGTDGNSLHVKSLRKPRGEWMPIVDGFTHHSSMVDHVDGRLYVLTDIDAPRYRLIAADPSDPSNQDKWQDVLPQTDDLLESVSVVGGQLWAVYLHNASNRVMRYDLDGSNARVVELPYAVGSVGGFGGKMESKELYYAFTSFTQPTSIYKMDIASGASELWSRPDVAFNPDDFEAHQEWYVSKDGTRVPMFIVHKKGMVKDGSNPTLLYAYGGFNISLTPSFSASNIAFLERGGIYAMPNLRGGGEFGEAWHKAGMLLKKQNVFDDFFAAGDHLVAEGYTSHDKLAIAGGSNGGLLVGAIMTQRPDFARVALPAVGVMDMLRYHKFTIGWGWIPEYGCADSSKADFENLLGYSPVHNLREGVTYPSTMVTTADHDDRVVPAHSFKFAARLQATHKGDRPVLLRVETNAGHGAGKPIGKVLDEQADKWAFVLHELNATNALD